MNSSQLKSLADSVIEALSDYPTYDSSEIIDELVAVFARDEELTRSQTEQLRDYVWSRV